MSRTAGMPSRNRLGSGQSRDAVAGQKFMKTASASQPFGEACHSQSAEVVLAHLGFAVTGLSATEAAKRLAVDGPNEFKEGKRISSLQIFLGQFKSFIVWILIVAGIISGVLGEMVDAIALLAIIVGGGVAGSASCVTRLRCLNESAEAIVPDHGPMAFFANCGLPYYIGGFIEQEDDLLVAKGPLFKESRWGQRK